VYCLDATHKKSFHQPFRSFFSGHAKLIASTSSILARLKNAFARRLAVLPFACTTSKFDIFRRLPGEEVRTVEKGSKS
jgi:hypothetical protein